MHNVINSTNVLLSKIRIKKPYEWKEELLFELNCINIKRIKILSSVLIMFLLFIIFLNICIPNTNQVDKYISRDSFKLHITLLAIAVTYLALISQKNRVIANKHKCIKILNIIFTSSVLSLCSVIAINNEITNQRPYTYVIAMFSIASLVLLELHERIFVFSISYIIYQIGIIIVSRNMQSPIENIILITPLITLAFIVSCINFSSYLSNFENKKLIQKKNEELDYQIKMTNDVLVQRTIELNHKLDMEKIRAAFFTNISHELRTPVNVIFSAEQIIAATLRKIPEQPYLKDLSNYNGIIRQNCLRLIRLINNLIDITKIDTGYLEANRQNCDLVKIIEDVTLSAASYFEGKGVNITFDTDTEEKIMAFDPDMIERIALNLLSNAVKFTPLGGSIYVSIHDYTEKVVISVKDNGIGIPKEMQTAIFELFNQVDKTISRCREGSGIGLYLVKSLVELHKGTINLKSMLGVGSEFIVEMPVLFVEQEQIDIRHAYSTDYCRNQNLEKIYIEFSDIYC